MEAFDKFCLTYDCIMKDKCEICGNAYDAGVQKSNELTAIDDYFKGIEDNLKASCYQFKTYEVTDKTDYHYGETITVYYNDNNNIIAKISKSEKIIEVIYEG